MIKTSKEIVFVFNRCVSCHRTEELKWRHDNYMITECSASTEVVEISNVFNTLINRVSIKIKGGKLFGNHLTFPRNIYSF
jgi:hypothetical protein